MTSENTPQRDLVNGREWLETAMQEWTDSAYDAAYSAAVIGNGYVGMAHTTASLEAMKVTVRAREAVLNALTEPSDGNELFLRVEDALSWLDDPKLATPEQRLAKIRECLEGKPVVDRG